MDGLSAVPPMTRRERAALSFFRIGTAAAAALILAVMFVLTPPPPRDASLEKSNVTPTNDFVVMEDDVTVESEPGTLTVREVRGDLVLLDGASKKGVTIGIERGTQFVAVVVTQAVKPDTTIAKVLAGLELREIKVGDRARILWDNPRSGNDPKKLRAKLQGWKRYKELKKK